MSFVEFMISSVVLANSRCAALGVWSQAAQRWQHNTKLQQQADQLELVRLATHRWLSLQGVESNLLISNSDQCLLDAAVVAASVTQAVPLPKRMMRQWVMDSQRLGLWQQLSALDVDDAVLLQRRQLISPAAYGLCRL